MGRRRALSLAAALAVAIGGGCAAPGGGPAPVVDRSTGPPGVPPHHTVRQGDSLYAIAWRHQLDYKAVAHLNGIGPPYTIFPGQQLKLPAAAPVRTGARPAPVTTAAERPAADTVPRRGATRSTPASRRADRAPERAPVPQSRPSRPMRAAPKPAPKPAAPPPTRPTAKPAPTPAAPPPTRATPKPAPATPAAKAPAPAASGGGRWRWPVDVRPSRGFGGGNNGFDYTVPRGKGVGAAAPGKVVYSGPGLGGYKHLVIVEHGGGYLSAYSINAAPQVAEGGAVAAGARLAEMSDANSVARRLHFEIRRNGDPVDPRKVIGR